MEHKHDWGIESAGGFGLYVCECGAEMSLVDMEVENARLQEQLITAGKALAHSNTECAALIGRSEAQSATIADITARLAAAEERVKALEEAGNTIDGLLQACYFTFWDDIAPERREEINDGAAAWQAALDGGGGE